MEEEKTEEKNQGFLQGNGGFSMRRLLALLFGLTSIFAGGFSIIMELEWKSIAVSFGVPAVACCLMMFFTTWGDVAKVAEKLKK